MVCNRKKGIISAELAMRSEAEYKNKWLKMKGEQEVVPRNNVQQSPKVPLPAPAPSPSSGPNSTRCIGPTSRVTMEEKQEAMPKNNVQPSPKHQVPPPAPAPSPSSARHTGPTPRPMLQKYQASGLRPQSRSNVSFILNKPPLSPGTARPMARQNIVSPKAATPPRPFAKHASVMPSVTTPTRPTTARPMGNHSTSSPTAPRPPVSPSPTAARTMAMHIPVSPSPTSVLPSTPSRSSTNSRLKRKEPWSSGFHPSLNEVELPETEVTEPAFDLRNRPFFCKLCVVDCQSMVSVKMHIKGRQHKAKLKLLSSAKSGGPVSQLLQCDLCKIWCMNEDNLQQHYKGKNHILKLHAAQMRNKAKNRSD